MKLFTDSELSYRDPEMSDGLYAIEKVREEAVAYSKTDMLTDTIVDIDTLKLYIQVLASGYESRGESIIKHIQRQMS